MRFYLKYLLAYGLIYTNKKFTKEETKMANAVSLMAVYTHMGSFSEVKITYLKIQSYVKLGANNAFDFAWLFVREFYA